MLAALLAVDVYLVTLPALSIAFGYKVRKL